MMRSFKVLGFAGDLNGQITEGATSPALGLLELGTLDPALQGLSQARSLGSTVR